MRLTENLTSEKSADTSGPRVESLIFLPGYAQNAEHTGLMLNSKEAGWCGKDEYRPKIVIIKVEKILKGSVDSIPSPLPSVKIQIMGGKVCLSCKGKTLLGVANKLMKTKSLLTSPSNVLP